MIGPRLVGSPAMKQANDWAVEKYKSWGIDAQNQQFGEWASWQRGITQVEMTSPRVKKSGIYAVGMVSCYQKKQ